MRHCKGYVKAWRDYLQVGMYTEIMFANLDEFTPFRNIINEWYAKDTSKKIRAVKKAKGIVGEHMSSHAPYGYRKNPDNLKEWLVDEEAAEVVREIFRLCVNGYGPMQIDNMLTEKRTLCPAAACKTPVILNRKRPCLSHQLKKERQQARSFLFSANPLNPIELRNSS